MAADVTDEVMEDAENRLRVTLRLPRERPGPRVKTGQAESQQQSILEKGTLGISALEQLSLITRAVMEGATAHKRSVETVIAPAGGKYTDLQMARLQGWCGLGPTERNKLPPHLGQAADGKGQG